MSKDLDYTHEVAALLPLKPQDYHILFVLLDGERHGYGMVKDRGVRPPAGCRVG
jgi:hypothetical protein